MEQKMTIKELKMLIEQKLEEIEDIGTRTIYIFDIKCLKEKEMEINELLKQIANYSKTPQHESIIAMLNYYNKNGVKDLTITEITDYLKILQNKERCL